MAALAAVYLVWGTTYFALKVGIEQLEPFYLLGTRFILAGALLGLWQHLRGVPLPSLREWGSASLLALLMLVLGTGNVTVAEKHVSSGAAVALISLVPLVTALWSGLFGRKPRGLEWLAIALGGAGTVVMVTGEDLSASAGSTALLLVAIGCWSCGTVLSSRLPSAPGAMSFAAEMLAAGVIGLTVSAARGEPWIVPTVPRVWFAWLYLVFFGSMIAFSAYRFLTERVSATLAATYAYVNPAVALVVGWMLGNERFSWNVLLGLPVVLCAVALHAFVQLRRAPARVAVPHGPGLQPESVPEENHA